MSVLYHLMIPQPRVPALDAVVQEVEVLRAVEGGQIVYLNPARRPGSRFPERLYGFHRLLQLRRREQAVRLHHVYNPHLFYFPYLGWLRRPIVYTVTAGLRPHRRWGGLKRIKRLSSIVVSSERDRSLLCEHGLENVQVIRPGIDTSRFSPAPRPSGRGFTLLAGSAPWTRAQFRSKGVETLLEVAKVRRDLRLVFLWRGLLSDEMAARVAELGLGERVEVIDRRVDVNEVLARVHAAVVLAEDATLVKAYPHSLLEALVVGRPVLVSRALAMADYVEQTGCGRVVEGIAAESLVQAVAQVEIGYEACSAAALQVGRRDFSQETMAEAYRGLYKAIVVPQAGGAPAKG